MCIFKVSAERVEFKGKMCSRSLDARFLTDDMCDRRMEMCISCGMKMTSEIECVASFERTFL